MYVEVVLYIVEDIFGAIKILEKVFILKEGSLGNPDRYLGVKVEIIQTTDGQVIRSMNCQ